MCDKPRTASTYAYGVDNFTSRMRCVVAYNSGESCDLNAEPDVIVERAEIIPLYQPSLYKLG